MSEINEQANDEPNRQADAKLSRRALMRAGLRAAPVVAALKTDLVLATTGTTVRPSCFASYQANKLSVHPGRNTSGSCLTIAECRTYAQTRCGTWYFFTRSGYNHCSFAWFSRGVSSLATMQSLVNTNITSSTAKNTKLAIYCAAAWLSADKWGSASFITSKDQCRKIWQAGGVWSPVAGVNWSLDQTLAYFDKVYFANSTFDPCLLTNGTNC